MRVANAGSPRVRRFRHTVERTLDATAVGLEWLESVSEFLSFFVETPVACRGSSTVNRVIELDDADSARGTNYVLCKGKTTWVRRCRCCTFITLIREHLVGVVQVIVIRDPFLQFKLPC